VKEDHLSRITRHSSLVTLIEGAGGLLAPLAQDCTALDIIRRLDCEVLVVAPNNLGTINHTLLTIRALHAPRSTRVVLMNCRSPDASAASNPRILSELLAPIPVHTIPFLGPAPCRLGAIRRNALVLERKLAALCCNVTE
jgi:dethiobiotin synthetase